MGVFSYLVTHIAHHSSRDHALWCSRLRRWYSTIYTLGLLQMLIRSSTAGLQAGAIIGLPPVLNFGSPELKARVVPEVLSGKKFICLAISEAFAGSDVMGLKTTATKTEDGKHWIITGTKKWITNGQYVAPLSYCCGTSERNFIDLLTTLRLDAKLTADSLSSLLSAVRALILRRSRPAIPQQLEQRI